MRFLQLGLLLLGISLADSTTFPAEMEPPTRQAAFFAKEKKGIPFSGLGERVSADYRGDGLSVSKTPEGARLCSAFQKLSATVDGKGLHLESDQDGGTLHLKACSMERATGLPLLFSGEGAVSIPETLPHISRTVLFRRSGITEEYSVSVDGLRQDFVIKDRPAGSGSLSLDLALRGATAYQNEGGVRLALKGSGRILTYGRLKVTDASGQWIAATMEVVSSDRITVKVSDDTWAAYPLRIDPTFSDADWESLNPQGMPGTDEHVNASLVDGSGNLYIGGKFAFAGNVAANRVAKWDGSKWSALGSGITGTNTAVTALAINGSDIYAAGYFTMAGGIPAKNVARWNGTTWSALGAGVGGNGEFVYALAVIGSDLYAGGNFTVSGNTTVGNIAKWNGSVWSSPGSGLNGRVLALAARGSSLFAAGAFSSAGGVQANNIAKWEAGLWSALGTGITGFEVKSLAVNASTLYAGGSFDTAGSFPANNIAGWNGTAWSPLGAGISGDVCALCLSGTDLYAGGDFSSAGDQYARNIAKWNGGRWTAAGQGGGPFSIIWGTLSTLSVTGTAVYAGGEFFDAGGDPARNIAKWNGIAWSTLGNGLNDPVNAITTMGNDIYIGGSFVNAAGITLNGIAKWNGTNWSSLGTGISGQVVALAVKGTDLIAAGYFYYAGGKVAKNIAKWNGSSWSALGDGLITDSVSALAVMGDDVYAGGSFTYSGSKQFNHVAKWNGTTWSALGIGLGQSNSEVKALAVMNGEIYAGGSFWHTGGIIYNGVAKWNGTAWLPLGLGIGPNGVVWALAVDGGILYAGGRFTTAGGTPANNIAKWNGSAWSALGDGLTGKQPHSISGPEVFALAVKDNNLFAAGDFVFAGGKIAENIAQWNGRSWFALGSGLKGNPYRSDHNGLSLAAYALAVNGSHLFAGGSFFTAGDKISPFLSKANITVIPEDAYSAAAAAAGLTGLRAEAQATPFNDGVGNLIKFAFNMNLAGADVRVLTGGTGTVGLPSVHAQLSTDGQIILTLTYLRLKGGYLTYKPKLSTDMTTFTLMSGTEQVTNIDSQWERVTLEQRRNPMASPKCFIAVEVSRLP